MKPLEIRGVGKIDLTLILDDASVDQKFWRVIIEDGKMQLLLLDDKNSHYRVLHVERRGTAYETYRNRDAQ